MMTISQISGDIMKTFNVITGRSKQDVYFLLQEVSNKKSDNRQFKGKVTPDGFSIMKYNFFSNNSLNPLLRGSVTEKNGKTHISVEVTMNKTDKIGFTALAVTFFILIFIAAISGVLSNNFGFVSAAFMLVVFGLAVAALFYGLFSINTERVISQLESLFA